MLSLLSHQWYQIALGNKGVSNIDIGALQGEDVTDFLIIAMLGGGGNAENIPPILTYEPLVCNDTSPSTELYHVHISVQSTTITTTSYCSFQLAEEDHLLQNLHKHTPYRQQARPELPA